MSPVYDPRFSEARWEKTLQKDREASDQAARMEYIKPLVMLVLGGAVVMGVYLLRAPRIRMSSPGQRGSCSTRSVWPSSSCWGSPVSG